MQVEWEKRLLQAGYSRTESKSGESLMETAEVAYRVPACWSPKVPGRECFWRLAADTEGWRWVRRVG